MSKQRYISTSFWDDEWVQELDPSEKFFYLYLMTNPLTNIAGVYKLTLKRMSFDTGYNTDTLQKIIARFEKDKKAFYFEGHIIMPSWPKHQKVKERDNNRKGIDQILNALEEEVFQFLLDHDYEYIFINELPRVKEAPSKPLQSPSNYLEFDLDSEFDLEREEEKEDSALSENKPEENPELTLDQRISEYIKVWNSSGLPEYRRLVLNIPDLGDVRSGIADFSHQDVIESIQNYAKIAADPVKYELFPRYSNCSKFLIKGVDNYYGPAAPHLRCIRDKEAAHKEARAKNKKKFVSVCSVCGEQYSVSDSGCPKCGSQERAISAIQKEAS